MPRRQFQAAQAWPVDWGTLCPLHDRAVASRRGDSRDADSLAADVPGQNHAVPWRVCDTAEVEPFGTPQMFVMGRCSMISMKRWRTDEVLEQVAYAGSDVEAIAKAVVGWANSHSCIQIRGGRGRTDRAFTMYADSGRGKGVLSLYAAENGGGPMLELRIEQICSMPPYDSDEAHAQLTVDLRALGIPRLDAEEILTVPRPNIPLDQLTGGRLERLLTLVDRCVE